MRVTVAGKQVETGEALKTHVSDGLTGISRKYFDHALQAQVTFHKNRSLFACDIQVHAARGLILRGEGEGADAHRAFDEAAEHLAKRLRRYRRRVNEHARSFAGERASDVTEPPRGRAYVLQRAEETEDEPDAEKRPDPPAQGNGIDHGTVIAEHPTHVDRLSVGEAVMHMDLTNAPVLMFHDKATGRVNVVYRRADGNVGWLDPGA